MMEHEVNNSIGAVNSIMHSALNLHQLWQQPSRVMLKGAFEAGFTRNENLNVFTRNFADLVKLPAPNSKAISLHQLVHAVVRLMKIKGAGQSCSPGVSVAK